MFCLEVHRLLIMIETSLTIALMLADLIVNLIAMALLLLVATLELIVVVLLPTITSLTMNLVFIRHATWEWKTWNFLIEKAYKEGRKSSSPLIRKISMDHSRRVVLCQLEK